MALLAPNVGEVTALEAWLKGGNHVLRLFKSNTTPAEGDTAGSYTEADFTGYSAITLTGSSWSVTGGAPSSATYAQQTFTSSAGSQNQNVYGYYITQVTTGTLMLAERFSDGPYNIANNGDNIKVTLNVTCD